MKNLLTIGLLILSLGLLVWAFMPQKQSQPPVPNNRFEVIPDQSMPSLEVKPEFPERATYVGPWRTEKNRKLDGTMTCDVHYLGNYKWEGKFHGTWHGQDFSYDVKWEGSPEGIKGPAWATVKGTATVSGVPYTWTGEITNQTFAGTFDSRRYVGDFRLERK